jgi:Flp pilus assembly protein TadG
MRSLRHNEEGQVVILVTMLLTVILVLAALVIDIGNAKQRGRGLQAAADSASLAAAAKLSSSVADAQADAEEYAFDSLEVTRPSTTVACPTDRPTTDTVCYQSGTGPIVYVTTPFTVTPFDGTSPTTAQAINVMICWSTPTTFGGVINISTERPCKSATADALSTAPSMPCAICVLGPGADALNIHGGSNMSITGGSGVVVESANNEAADFSGSGNLTVASPGTVNITGRDSCKVGCTTTDSGTVSPKPATGVPSIGDPLGTLVAPSVAGTVSAITVHGAPQTINPGVYSSISITGDEDSVLTMNPGTYVITGPFTIGNDGSVIGTGVTLYFTCSGYSTTNTSPCPPGGSGGYFLENGDSHSMLTAPTTAGTYQHLLMFYDRNNIGKSASCGMSSDFVTASGVLTTTGTVYAKGAKLCIEGSGLTLNTLFVVGAMDLGGSGAINANVSPSEQVLTPGVTALPGLVG